MRAGLARLLSWGAQAIAGLERPTCLLSKENDVRLHQTAVPLGEFQPAAGALLAHLQGIITARMLRRARTPMHVGTRRSHPPYSSFARHLIDIPSSPPDARPRLPPPGVVRTHLDGCAELLHWHLLSSLDAVRAVEVAMRCNNLRHALRVRPTPGDARR